MDVLQVAARMHCVLGCTLRRRIPETWFAAPRAAAHLSEVISKHDALLGSREHQ